MISSFQFVDGALTGSEALGDRPSRGVCLAHAESFVLRSIEEDVTRLDIDVLLEDSALHVGPIAATGANGGRLTGDLRLDPASPGVRVRTEFTIEQGRLDMSSAIDDPSEWPSIDIEVTLDATGDSPHALASVADGRVAVVVGEEAIGSSIVNLVAADVLRTILDTLSPFRKENPSSRLECADVFGRIDDGVAVVAPVAVQTDKLTVLGAGRIDLGPETLGLEWEIKPPNGIGVSASTLTNPYLKLGGTLARPRLEMKGVQAVTSTGVAVATGGLSLLGEGLSDRITAERKVCQRAIERAEREEANRAQAGRDEGDR